MMLGLQRLRCRRVRKALWDYVAKRLSEGPMEMVERHIAACTGCRREAESMRRAQGLLAAYQQESIPAPRSDWQALRSRLETATPVAPYSYEGHRQRHRLPSRQFARLIAPRRNRWAHSLSRSGAFAALLLLAAFGYRNMHLFTLASLQQTMPFQVAHATSGEAQAPVISPPHTSFTTGEAGSTELWPGFPLLTVGDASIASHAGVRPIGSTRSHNEAPQHARVIATLTPRPSVPGAAFQRSPGLGAVSAQSRGGSPQFRHYTPRPEDALPQAGTAENRYVMNGVVPIDNRHGTYVTPALQPVPSDHDAPY